MDQREFEAVLDEWGASAKDLVDLVEDARYEQPTAMAISRLLDAREDLLALIAKLPTLREVAPPDHIDVGLAAFPIRITRARKALKTSHDAKEILQLATEVGEAWETLVAPLQAAARWPKPRGR